MKTRFSQTVQEHTAWAEHRQGVLNAVLRTSSDAVKHAVAGVATYGREFHACGLVQSDWVLMATCGFCSVGKRKIAGGFLQTHHVNIQYVERWLEMLPESHDFSLFLPFFSRGILAPAGWVGAHQDRIECGC